ncbi:MAG: hypothetical protein FWE98_00410 [Oscillospiraceae bacterium]|nr:hypothetical protein [Oscillospiraceae bacterium]
MFCDTCHWYTAGESVCPHCGAPQSPKKAKDMFRLPGDVSILDGAFMDGPLVNTPMPDMAAGASTIPPPPPPPPAPRPPSVPAPPPPSIAPSPRSNFCGRCGARANAGRFCSRCGAPLI